MTANVVLIEDQHAVRATLRDFLRATGDFRIVAALGTEAEAVDWVEGNPDSWDLAVVDLILDQGTGLNVIKRAREASDKGRIVVLSGYAGGGLRDHCRKLGADAVFDKADLPAFVSYCRRISPKGPAKH